MPISMESAASALVTSALTAARPTSSRIMPPPFEGSFRPSCLTGAVETSRSYLIQLYDEFTGHDHASSRARYRADAFGRLARSFRAAQGSGVRFRTARYQPAARSERPAA